MTLFIRLQEGITIALTEIYLFPRPLAAGPSRGGDRQRGPEVWEWSLHLLWCLSSHAAIFRWDSAQREGFQQCVCPCPLLEVFSCLKCFFILVADSHVISYLTMFMICCLSSSMLWSSVNAIRRYTNKLIDWFNCDTSTKDSSLQFPSVHECFPLFNITSCKLHIIKF